LRAPFVKLVKGWGDKKGKKEEKCYTGLSHVSFSSASKTKPTEVGSRVCTAKRKWQNDVRVEEDQGEGRNFCLEKQIPEYLKEFLGGGPAIGKTGVTTDEVGLTPKGSLEARLRVARKISGIFTSQCGLVVQKIAFGGGRFVEKNNHEAEKKDWPHEEGARNDLGKARLLSQCRGRGLDGERENCTNFVISLGAKDPPYRQKSGRGKPGGKSFPFPKEIKIAQKGRSGPKGKGKGSS